MKFVHYLLLLYLFLVFGPTSHDMNYGENDSSKTHVEVIAAAIQGISVF